MENNFALSKREQEVAELLLQGKSNKQIALALKISDHTVEFHLKNLYTKLQVSSRSEAILKLGKSPGGPLSGNQGESVVAENQNISDNKGKNKWRYPGMAGHTTKRSLLRIAKFIEMRNVWVILGLAVAVLIISVFARPAPWEGYERECEYPDEVTVGQMILRPNASNAMVHGQFGVEGSPPWLPQPGYVIYKDIRIPKLEQLFLRIRYSKNSPASVPILVYIDDESIPRAGVYPKDQQNWDQFTWTEPINLRNISGGVHLIKLVTDGQQYGVADLDKLILTNHAP